MAEIAPIKCSYFPRGYHLLAPRYAGAPPLGVNVDMSQEIRGTVVEVDDADVETVVPNAEVRLFYHQSTALVARVQTDSIGQFAFTGLLAGNGRYYVIAFYPSADPTRPNARIYARLTAQEP